MYPELDVEDIEYVKKVVEMMRRDRKEFINEKDRRYKYFELKYKKPNLMNISIDKLAAVVTKDVKAVQDPNKVLTAEEKKLQEEDIKLRTNRVLLNYNYIWVGKCTKA